jgi:hypothetical protein
MIRHILVLVVFVCKYVFMTVPLDRLYHYILSIANETYGDDVIIYRFWPHGSKNLDNLAPLLPITWASSIMYLPIYCNDQEPLHYEYYQSMPIKLQDGPWVEILKSINWRFLNQNLKKCSHIFQKSILLHSEKRSSNLEKYQQDGGWITAYYWSHGILARDWFRYAEHVKQKKQCQKLFLIYNRAWSGTREYRLKFTELLLKKQLQDYCKATFNPVEPELGIHYNLHKFCNPAWKPTIILENYFSLNHASSHYSADFEIEDYEFTNIEIVLETLFDDDRLHLTEKSLRPIACAQPFILVGTHGSLEYLQEYGFKTFGHIWDESYDQIEDPEERLIKIADLMRAIADWTPEQRTSKMSQAQAVADHNKKHFFSSNFFDIVTTELTANLKLAFDAFECTNDYHHWLERWDRLLSTRQVTEFLDTNQNISYPTKLQVELVYKHVQKKLSLIKQ